MVSILDKSRTEPQLVQVRERKKFTLYLEGFFLHFFGDSFASLDKLVLLGRKRFLLKVTSRSLILRS